MVFSEKSNIPYKAYKTLDIPMDWSIKIGISIWNIKEISKPLYIDQKHLQI